MVLVSIGSDADTARTAAGQDLEGVIKATGPGLGLVITVSNYTDRDLRFLRGSRGTGDRWVEQPDDDIPPDNASVFSIYEQGPLSILEGSRTYEIGATNPHNFVRVWWKHGLIGGYNMGAWDFYYEPVPDSFGPFGKQMYPHGVPVGSAQFQTSDATSLWGPQRLIRTISFSLRSA